MPDELNSLRVELLQQRRSLSMLSPEMPLSREKAMALLDKCLQVVDASRRGE